MSDATCSWSECTNAAKSGPLCWTHKKRAQRKRPMDPIVRDRGVPPGRRLEESAISFWETNSLDHVAVERGWDLLRKAAVKYEASLAGDAEKMLAGLLKNAALNFCDSNSEGEDAWERARQLLHGTAVVYSRFLRTLLAPSRK